MEQQPEESPFVVPEDDVPEAEEESEGEHNPPPELQDEGADDA